jgi:hypothetical protein
LQRLLGFTQRDELLAQLGQVLGIIGCQRDGLVENVDRLFNLPVMRGNNAAQEPGIGKVLIELENSQAVLVCVAQFSFTNRRVRGAMQGGDLLLAGCHLHVFYARAVHASLT